MTPSPLGRSFWLIAAGGICSVLIAFSPGRFFATDVGARLAVSRSLWMDADVFVPGDARAQGLVYLAEKGTSTSLYGVGQSLILIPFDYIGHQMGRFASLSEQQAAQTLPVVFAYIPLVGTAWWLLLCAVLTSMGVERREALLLTLVFGLSTMVWFYTSQSAQEEALVGALLTGAFLCALRWKRHALYAWGAGALAAAALLTRLNAFLGLLPLLGLALDLSRAPTTDKKALLRALARALGGALPVLGLLLMFSHWRFGSALSTGYDIARNQGMGVFWGPASPQLALELAVGFGKGLLTLSPPLLIAGWGLRAWSKQKPFTAGGVVMALLLSLWICSRILNNPEGSESWGARYQVHLLGFAIVPFYLGWRSWCARGWQGAAFALVTIGFFIQLASVFAPTSMEYLQVQGDTITREKITASATQGQLPLRLRNLGQWVMGRSAASSVSEDQRALFTTMESHYVPNLAAFVYAKRWGSKWPLFASLVLFLSGLAALSTCLRESRSDGRVGKAVRTAKRIEEPVHNT